MKQNAKLITLKARERERECNFCFLPQTMVMLYSCFWFEVGASLELLGHTMTEKVKQFRMFVCYLGNFQITMLPSLVRSNNGNIFFGKCEILLYIC